jgi:cysteinyl-tRNA synthetase
MDLKFPHHDCEIAQCIGTTNEEPAKYWLHTNMLTVNGQKMSKSLGNSFLPWQLISGDHEMLDRGYSPMSIRFFMLQSHYASTLDFSNEALNGSLKGYTKLANGIRILKEMVYPENEPLNVDTALVAQVNKMCDDCHHAMNDDFNTALTIGHLFNLLKKVNSLYAKQITFAAMDKVTFDRMKTTLLSFTEDILGIKPETYINGKNLLSILLEDYAEAKATKDYKKVDVLRQRLKEEGITIKDMKDFVGWAYNE